MDNNQFNNDDYVRQLLKDDNLDTKIARFIYRLYGDDSFDRIERENQQQKDELQQAINDRYTQQLINDNNLDTTIAKWIYGLYGDNSFNRLTNK